MQRLPYVELCVCTPKFKWLRVSGKAVFSDDPAMKAKVLECSEMVKSMYKSADNPIFEIFYLDEAKAVLSDFSGEPPKEFTL